MLWLIAIAAEVVLETIITLRYRLTARNNPNDGLVATTVIYGLGVAPVGIVYALFFSGQELVLTRDAVLWTVLASVLFATANVMIYRAYAKMDASLYVIINSSKVIVTILGAFILLGDALEPRQLLGAGMILAASVYVSVISHHRKTKSVALRYILLAFAASVVAAFAQLSERVAVVATPMASYILLGWSLQALLLFLFAAPKLRRAGFHLVSSRTRGLMTTGILRGIAGVCIVYAVATTQNASLVFSLAATKVVAVSVAGYVFLRERSFAITRFIVAILTTIGVLLVVI